MRLLENVLALFACIRFCTYRASNVAFLIGPIFEAAFSLT